MSSLISLAQEYQEILKEIELAEGQLSEALENRLAENLQKSAEKVSNYVLMLDMLSNKSKFISEQIKKAQDYKAQIDSKIEFLESIAMRVIETTGRLEGNNGSWISSRKNVKVHISDETKIPPTFYKIKTELDKAAIKEALKNGEQVEGAVLMETKHISWK